MVVVIDDETEDYSLLSNEYQWNNLTLAVINHTSCLLAGITNCNFTLNKMVTGWEKAIFLSNCFVTSEDDKIWFLEDDVFFYDEHTLLNIDEQYPDTDLLTAPCTENNNDDPWHWKVIPIYDIAPTILSCYGLCIKNDCSYDKDYI